MLPLGPVMVDLAGSELRPEDIDRLRHPACGGVILFARNYQSPEQIERLTRSIRAVREPALLIAVDQEGGRVQRFRESFLSLPPLRALGRRYDQSVAEALALAQRHAWLMASECLAVGVDFSFAPVLDLDYGASGVIGDRALHADPEVVGALAEAYIGGMRRAGMAAVGKHFPGHGFVAADSHVDLPVDTRTWAEIERADLQPFACGVRAGLAGVMPAHVVYSSCDPQPAGFSRFWLQDVLRERLGFEGVIFSDDLSMAGAGFAGGPAERALAALAAGCEMLLVCNQPAAADATLETVWRAIQAHPANARLERMRAGVTLDWRALHASSEWGDASASLIA